MVAGPSGITGTRIPRSHVETRRLEKDCFYGPSRSAGAGEPDVIERTLKQSNEGGRVSPAALGNIRIVDSG